MKIGLLGAMFLIMFAGKVVGAMDWSWWVVTSPLWGPVVFPVALFAAVWVLGLAIISICQVFDK